MKRKSSNTEAVPYLLSAGNVEAFWSGSLEAGHDRIFETSGLALSRRECNRLWVEILTRVRSGRNDPVGMG